MSSFGETFHLLGIAAAFDSGSVMLTLENGGLFDTSTAADGCGMLHPNGSFIETAAAIARRNNRIGGGVAWSGVRCTARQLIESDRGCYLSCPLQTQRGLQQNIRSL